MMYAILAHVFGLALEKPGCNSYKRKEFKQGCLNYPGKYK